ncbi:phosphdiesterase [Gregarina niphandrodes]|uniref:Phosphodiesterase n=1 Tax=Gregarina niphandrodes TaxID=110365 RepID=A0A023B3K1_GRENI|nr:phosphdiesterase [Gregarina niphandrodes]EZG55538.1 phosphdiesterase [Gregarina niphandrodes]|eukprot:XP_011131524.1 phosphdiesterase [Gregarina niphandrodes]
MNVASMKMMARINDYVVRCLIPAAPSGSLVASSPSAVAPQRRRESAPSECIIELVYGAFLSSGECCRWRTVPWGSAGWFTVSSAAAADPWYQRRASAPVLLAEQRGRRTSAIWNARCIDYFVMSDQEFVQFFENSLSPFAPAGSRRLQRLNFYRFVLESYRSTNPYHNKYHAVQVYHVTWHMTQCIQSYYHYCYPLLIAAMIHDVDHLGVTNNYLIAVEHPLSILYNDMNILEQHHCAFIFTALSERSDLDIFSRLGSAEKRTIRKIIIQLILSTDMAKHASLMTALTTHLAPKAKDQYSPDDLFIFGQVVLHASDLSNQLTPFPYFVRWAGLCVDEFNRQVELEKKNNVPVTTFMNCTNDKSMIEMELGFLEFVVLPLWQPLVLIEPQLNQWVDTGRQNGKFWKTAIHINDFRKPTRLKSLETNTEGLDRTEGLESGEGLDTAEEFNSQEKQCKCKQCKRKQCNSKQCKMCEQCKYMECRSTEYRSSRELGREESGNKEAAHPSPDTFSTAKTLDSEEDHWSENDSPSAHGFESENDHRLEIEDDLKELGDISTELTDLDNPSARLFIRKWHS